MSVPQNRRFHPGTSARRNSTNKPKPKPTRRKSHRPDPFKARLLAASSRRCVYCGDPLTLSTVTKDHIYPQRLSGPDLFENMVACCSICNCAKADMHPIAWFKSRPPCAAGFLLLASHVCPEYKAMALEVLVVINPDYINPPLRIRFMRQKLYQILGINQS